MTRIVALTALIAMTAVAWAQDARFVDHGVGAPVAESRGLVTMTDAEGHRLALVLSTGAQANLNHMFAARNDDSWLGLIYLAVAVILMVGAWVVAKPAFTQPVAALTGKVTR